MAHFTIGEFEKSETANKLGYNNHIPVSLYPNVQRLIKNVLEPIRTFVGCAVYINSGYRCPLLNKAVGGVPSSQHVLGMAADITTKDRKKDLRIVDWVTSNLEFDQMIVYKTFVHISYNKNRNRHEIIYKAK